MTPAHDESAPHTTNQTEKRVYIFLTSRVPAGELREEAQLLLSCQDLPRVLEEISQEDKEGLIDKLNQVYLAADAQEKRFLDLFGVFCSVTKQFPSSASLSTRLDKCDDFPATNGCLTDIWRGHYRGTLVAIKTYRACPAQQDIVWIRVPTWKKISHPNIAEFHGVATAIIPLALIYAWEKNGNIIHYVHSNPQSPRLPLLLQVARGLQCLHSLGVTHGNLKGTNILVDGFGHVRLTDYGLAPLYVDPNLAVVVGNSRWLAPEIIDPPPHAPRVTESEPADIFAFGILGIEVFTGQPPFGKCGGPNLLRRILDGERPKLPLNARAIGLTPRTFELLERCWHRDPGRRPTIVEVVRLCEDRSELVPDTVSFPDTLQPIPPLEVTGGGQPTRPDTRRKWRRKWLCCLG